MDDKTLIRLSEKLKALGFKKESKDILRLKESAVLMNIFSKANYEKQEEFSHPSFQKFFCAICNSPEQHDEMFAATKDQIYEHFGSPKYILQEGSHYPVCNTCNEKHFTESNAEFSEFKQKSVGAFCLECLKVLNESEYELYDNDELIRNNIKIPEEYNEVLKELSKEHGLPVCHDCMDEKEETLLCSVCNSEEMEEEGYLLRYEDFRETDVSPDYKTSDDQYFVCNDCHVESFIKFCFKCEEFIELGETSLRHISGKEREICNDCLSNLVPCSDDYCDELIDVHDGDYIISSGGEYFCEDCIGNENNIRHLEGVARKTNTNLSVDTYNKETTHLPLSPALLSSFKNILEPLAKKYHGRSELPSKASNHLLNLINRMKVEEEERAFIIDLLWSGSDFAHVEKIEELLSATYKSDLFNEEISKNFKLTKKHKRLKQMKSLPVDVFVVEPRSSYQTNSFVVSLHPNYNIMKTAEEMWGDDAAITWELMAEAGVHHSGAVAYCRIGNYEGEWLIENLQTDADVSNLKRNLNSGGYYTDSIPLEKRTNEYKARFLKIGKWFENQFKGWEAYFIFLVKKMAEDEGVRCFITSSEYQEGKWPSIPNGALSVYDEIPKEMYDASVDKSEDRFPRKEKYSGDTEDQDEPIDEELLWRLASNNK